MMQEKRLKDKDIFDAQSNFVQNLEGAGDILVFETKRKKNDIVEDGLDKIYEIIKILFSLQKNDPEKFEKLLLKKEYFEIYKNDKERAGTALYFFPEKYLIGFSVPVNQIFRIHETALEAKNDSISRYATYRLIHILSYIAKSKENKLFVEELLKRILQVSRKAINNNDASMYAATFHWYTSVVFELRLPEDEESFNLDYLDLFDRYLFSSIQYVINEGKFNLFKDLVRILVEGIHVPIYSSGDIWNYAHILLNSDVGKYNDINNKYHVEKIVSELDDTQKYIYSKNSLEKWISKFNRLQSILLQYYSEEQKIKALEIKKKILEDAEDQYKYNNLLNIIFTAGAFCVFKEKASYIKYLWEFKQPSDSDASWSGHNIIPENIDEVVRFHFQKSYLERRVDFWEDHHGSEQYYNQYFILLLARSLKNSRKNPDTGQYTEILNYNIPNLHVYSLSDIEHSVDNLIQVAKSLKNKKMFFVDLGFEESAVDDLIDERVIKFLEILKERSIEGIKLIHKNQKVSNKKIKEFKEQFISEFKKTQKIRDIFSYYELFDDKTNQEAEKGIKKLGINIVDDKAIFFKDWHVSFHKWGENYGRDIARGEDTTVISQIKSLCSPGVDDIESILTQMNDVMNLIIISTNQAFSEFLDNQDSFLSKWRTKKMPLEIESFEGWYISNDIHIPVFHVYDNSNDNIIFIVNKNKFGKLIQLSPLDKLENEKNRYDIFSINIGVFSEDNALMKKYLDNPPDWLSKMGSGDNQKEYLKERALIQIFEKFEFRKDDQFSCRMIKLKDD